MALLEFGAKLQNSGKLSEFYKNSKAIALPFGTFEFGAKLQNSVKLSESCKNSKAIALPFWQEKRTMNLALFEFGAKLRNPLQLSQFCQISKFCKKSKAITLLFGSF